MHPSSGGRLWSGLPLSERRVSEVSPATPEGSVLSELSSRLMVRRLPRDETRSGSWAMRLPERLRSVTPDISDV
jgi:hypothetical protein